MVAGSLWTMLVIFRLYVICFYPCNLERTDHSIIQQINLFYFLKHQHMWFIKSKKAPNLYRKKPAIEIQGRLIPVSQRWGPKLVKQNLTAWKKTEPCVYLTTCSLHQIKQSFPSNVITQDENKWDYNEQHCW